MKKLIVLAVLFTFFAPSISFGTVLEDVQKKAEEPQFIKARQAREAIHFFVEKGIFLTLALSDQEKIDFFNRVQNNPKLQESLFNGAAFIKAHIGPFLYFIFITGELSGKQVQLRSGEDDLDVIISINATDEEIIRELSLPK